MELLQLRYFYESSQNQSFAKTAQKYQVPATSVSASIKRLENELGVKLFDRYCNKIILNDNGKKLHRSLCLIFDELDRVSGELSNPKDDDREIKLLVRTMRSKVTDCIIRYKERYPQVKFKTVFDYDAANPEEYDIIIDERSDEYDGYQSFELCNTNIKIIASSDNPLCGKKINLCQLSNQPFVSMGEKTNMQKILNNACLDAGFTPNVVFQCNDILCYERSIRSGIGIGVVRDNDPHPASGTAPLNVVDFNSKYIVYGYYKKQSEFGNVKHFIEFLKSQAE